MSEKYARVVSKRGRLTPQGYERVHEVRRGREGAGARIGNSIATWPWSPKSQEEGDKLLAYVIGEAEAMGYTVIQGEEW